MNKTEALTQGSLENLLLELKEERKLFKLVNKNEKTEAPTRASLENLLLELKEERELFKLLKFKSG